MTKELNETEINKTIHKVISRKEVQKQGVEEYHSSLISDPFWREEPTILLTKYFHDTYEYLDCALFYKLNLKYLPNEFITSLITVLISPFTLTFTVAALPVNIVRYISSKTKVDDLDKLFFMLSSAEMCTEFMDKVGKGGFENIEEIENETTAKLMKIKKKSLIKRI